MAKEHETNCFYVYSNIFKNFQEMLVNYKFIPKQTAKNDIKNIIMKLNLIYTSLFTIKMV